MKALMVALALGTGVALAQAPADHTDTHMQRLAILLDLTDAQQAQVQSILSEEHAKLRQSFEAARAQGSRPDFRQMRALHAQIRQETMQKLTPVLSPLQLEKFRLLSEMHGHHWHRPALAPEGTPSPPPQ